MIARGGTERLREFVDRAFDLVLDSRRKRVVAANAILRGFGERARNSRKRCKGRHIDVGFAPAAHPVVRDHRYRRLKLAIHVDHGRECRRRRIRKIRKSLLLSGESALVYALPGSSARHDQTTGGLAVQAVPLTPTESVATLAAQVAALMRLGVSHKRASLEIGRKFGLSPITVARLTWPYVATIEVEDVAA